MEIWLFGIIGILTLAVIILSCTLISFRHSVREIADELVEKMSCDTNTLISISSADKNLRFLANQINLQLRELRKERLRLQNGDNELKTAVTNISHDLRTPLTAICGYLDLMEQEENNEIVTRYLEIIRERTDSLKSLMEELLKYSVITSTADELTIEDTNINNALEVSIAALYGAFKERGIIPVIRMPEQAVIRELDSTALNRIFSNILNNALKYSDGDLSVTLSDNGSITFSNTAKKLNQVDVEKLFNRFYTVENAHNTTGLGLSIAKLLTEKMNGKITAEYSDDNLTISLFWEK